MFVVRLIGLGWIVFGGVFCLFGYAPGAVNALLFSGGVIMVTGALLVIYAKLDEIAKKLK